MNETWKLWEGQVVDNEFHLRRYLGGSEHGAVFLTERAKGNPQKAAIKLVSADPETAELLLAQWELATKLSHPHLIRLFRTGRCQLGNMDLVYVVMEYAEESLSQILPHRALTPEEARDMLEPVLKTLGCLHDMGVVHGHVKPSNIMAVDDQLKMSSDGLREMHESNRAIKKPSVYDPPEAAIKGIASAGDVWSLGMTLVEVLTQQIPIWQGTFQGEPTLPVTLPASFADFARHCLLRDPEARDSIAGLTLRLRQNKLAPPVRAVAQAQPSSRKWVYVASTVAVVVVVVWILMAPKIVRHGAESQHASNTASVQPKVQPNSKRQAEVHPTTQPSESPAVAPAKPAITPPAPVKAAEHLDVPPTPAPSKAKTTPSTETHAGNSVPVEVVHRVLPEVSQKARDTIRGTVRVGVKVDVDRSGNVVDAALDSPGPSKYFADIALQAAQGWSFAPAKSDDARALILRFEFDNTETRVIPIPAAQ
ncbi:MAG: TonB family protein [Candidatus Acidiferrales bacterium]